MRLRHANQVPADLDRHRNHQELSALTPERSHQLRPSWLDPLETSRTSVRHPTINHMTSPATRQTQPRAFVSLFSGAGGLDTGLEWAGWKPLAAVEMDADAVGTLELSAQQKTVRGLPSPLIYHSKIEDIDPADLRKELGLARGELDLLAGGPPCQPFTTHGLRKSISDARASGLWPTYFRYVEEFSPNAILIENVDGLLSAALRHRTLAERENGIPLDWTERKGSFLLWTLKELSRLGYTLSWGLVEAKDFGVAQSRQRAILVGTKSESPFFLPEPSHGDYGEREVPTLRDVILDIQDLGAIQPLSAKKRAVYAMIPPGGNWRNLPEKIQAETMGRAYSATGGKSGWWRRLAWDRPSPTILGMPDHSSTALIHPSEDRCLSVLECAALQSFPKEYRFAGSARSQYQQIGNAVPPLLAKALGVELLRFLDGIRRSTPEPPPWRKSSANRRIGTHGWIVNSPSTGPELVKNVKVRGDHIWSEPDAWDRYSVDPADLRELIDAI